MRSKDQMMGSETLRTIEGPALGSRVIVIGDIHGCINELRVLFDRLAPAGDDIVISAGDVVRKGPRADLCLDLFRAHGGLAVIGNNDEKLLERARWGFFARWFAAPEDRAVLRRRDLLDFIRTWPVVIDIPAIGASVVHGGLFPGMTIDSAEIARTREDLIRLRYVRREGNRWVRVPKGSERETDVLWSEVWDGGRTVLYGHTPMRDASVDSKTIGLDTGCVYGGSLTAAVYEHGRWRLEQVRAQRAYATR
ncbi:MAG: metallophosphoesterase [Thermoanaerobaculia bacterium]